MIIFLLGAWLRGLDLWRGVDGMVRESWRECDIAAVAKNFYHEGMNILYPRIDWRGDGPGYAEMEFPIFPWTIAAFYKVFGFHEVIGRILSYVLSLATLVVFFILALRLMSQTTALLSALFFAFSPLSIRISNALQPEGLMLLSYIIAIYAFLRWLDEEKRKWYLVALLATAIALLAKINAIHVGFLFVFLLVWRKGFSFMKDWRIWLFAVLAMLPAALWYLHAHQLYLTYGNSLGVSNEYHWAGLELFTNPKMIFNILRIEALFVWMPAGVVILYFATRTKESKQAMTVALFWLASIFIYYLVAARTTGDDWAIYYHVVSVPPLAILFGIGVREIFHHPTFYKRYYIALFIAVALELAIVLVRATWNEQFSMFMATFITVVCAGGMVLLFAFGSRATNHRASLGQRVLTVIGAFAVFSTLLFQGFRISKDLHPQYMMGKYFCARAFKPLVPKGALIIASGGNRLDETGHQVAYNAPYMFYWMEHKGFNIAKEDQSLHTVFSLMKRGAKYFVAEKEMLRTNPVFEDKMRREFPILAQCDEAYLFYLQNGASQ